MIDVKKLESRWFKYKIKSFTPYVVIIISIAVIVTVSYVAYEYVFNKNTAPQELIKPKAPKEDVIQKEHIEIEKKIPQIKESVVEKAPVEKKVPTPQPKLVEDKKVILSPSMNFMDNIKDSSPKKQAAPKPSIEQKQTLDIKRKNTSGNIDELIKRFNKNNSPTLSLFIAKKYYKMGDYHNAYNYALKTNNINNNIESSWIIFSKSLVKLHKKDKAIKTLKHYIKYSSSSRAKILLDDILRGKFHAD